MISSTQIDVQSVADETLVKEGEGVPASDQQELSLLRRALQEQRRATTLLRAEAEKERQLREALEAQLLEANAEIVSSWDRRKEMARVLGEQQKRIADLQKRLSETAAERKATDQQIAKLEQVIAQRQQVITQREQVIAQRQQVIANREQAIAKRDEGLAKRDLVIANRDEKIRKLKDELQARYEELATLQRELVESTLSGKTRRLARRVRGFARKTFKG